MSPICMLAYDETQHLMLFHSVVFLERRFQFMLLLIICCRIKKGKVAPVLN